MTQRHPPQQLTLGTDGVLRFRKNTIVDYLFSMAKRQGVDMNDLAKSDFPREDRVQFAQLIGYSLGGFGSLSYVDDEDYEAANKGQKEELDTSMTAHHISAELRETLLKVISVKTLVKRAYAEEIVDEAVRLVEMHHSKPVTSEELNTAMTAHTNIDSFMSAIDRYAAASQRSQIDVDGRNQMRRHIEQMITQLTIRQQEPMADYSTFFYELAAWMEIPNAASRSPAEVWAGVMFPNIKQTRDNCNQFGEALQKIGTALDLMVGDDTTRECLKAIEKLKAHVDMLSRGTREETVYRGAKRAMEEFAVMFLNESHSQYSVRRERAWNEKCAADQAAVEKALDDDKRGADA